MKLWFTYFPFLAVGFVLMGVFLLGQLRQPLKSSWSLTFVNWSAFNILVLVTPLVVLLIIQLNQLINSFNQPT